MITYLVAVCLSVSLAGGVVPLAAQPHMIVISDSSGDRAGGQPRTDKPTGAAYKPQMMVFLAKRNVTDSKGRVVTGVGFVTWMEGVNAKVDVMLLVPKPGAPNEYLADASSPDKISLLKAEPLASFTLAAGEEHRIEELRNLGGVMTVRFK